MNELSEERVSEIDYSADIEWWEFVAEHTGEVPQIPLTDAVSVIAVSQEAIQTKSEIHLEVLIA